MDFLLKLSSWKLFLLLVLPCFFTFIPLLGMLLTALWIVIYMGWIYSIGVSMHNLIPKRIKPEIGYFKFNCIFNIVVFIAILITGGYNSETAGDFNLVFIPITFYAIWSLIYVFSFAARMLESVIEGEIVGISDSIKGLFCFWFFPFGVWHIQPAVERVLEKYKNQA
jgi:hypothetical protein